MLAERDGGGFDAAHAASADQQVGLEAELGDADQMQFPGAAPDQRRTLLAERDGGGFDAAHTAGADQQVGLEAELGDADQMQLPGAAPDQRAHRASAQPE